MSRIDLNVDVHHLTRVEGHGNIVVKVEDGVIKESRWTVVETPRYFEVMLKGQPWDLAALLVSRICGICSIGHTLASVRATENAFGLQIPPAAAKLRLLAKHAETLQSHALHLYFLAAPDFLGLDSAIPLIEKNPAVVGIAATTKGVGNRLCDLVAGRTTHPVSIQVGGMAVRPDRAKLAALRDELKALPAGFAATRDLLATFDIPAFARQTEFVALKGERDYPWIGGPLGSTDGVVKPEADYRAMTNEWSVADQTTKWCKLSRGSFAVGALARFNLNSEFLRPEAKEYANALGLRAVSHNPYHHNVAQLVEMVHVTYEAIRLIDELLALPDDEPLRARVEPKAATGVGAVEVPRGILYHEYTYGPDGRIEKANCIIPTTQNHKNIQDDMEALVKQFAVQGMSDRRLELLCSMLVRAYDPCISCSVH